MTGHLPPSPIIIPPTQEGDGTERLPPATLTSQELATFDEARRVLGVTERELVQIAGRWWNRTGRHLIRHPDFRSPDAGLPSGITRGLAFAELQPIEQQRVTLACWTHKIVPALQQGLSLDPLHKGA